MNAATKQVAKSTAKTEIRQIENDLKLLRERLVAALPRHIPVQSFISTVLTACATEPKLLDCDRHSLFLSALKAARDGLLPDGRESALVPFKDNQTNRYIATYIPMFAGLLKKVRNSGELASISAHVVYENDEFEYLLGDDERIVHRPARERRGKPLKAYAIAKTKDGGVYRTVLSAEDIGQVKDFSKAKRGPWHGPFEAEMWKKTAIRRLSKILPQSTDLNQYLGAGPALPADEVHGVLPDQTGDAGAQVAEFDLRSRALLVLREECEDINALQAAWIGVKASYKEIGAEIPLELEDAYHIRTETLKEQATQS